MNHLYSFLAPGRALRAGSAHFKSWRYVLVLLAWLLPGAAWAQAPSFLAALSFNPDGIYGTSIGRATASDAAGNQYVTGSFTGTITLGSTTLTSAGGTDVFVAKRNAATGAWLWAVRAGGTGAEVGYGIAADASGNALVTGSFAGTASFATSPAATSLTSAGSTDVFVAKFDAASGACAWAVRAGGTVADAGNGLVVDASGNALVTGSFAGTASFATSPAATSLTAAGGGNNDVFVAKFGAADGACAWAVRAGGTGADVGYGIAADASGNALVTGSFIGTAGFATSPAATSLTSAGVSNDAFVAKFGAADGTCAWAVRAGGTGDDYGYGIAVDASGNALVTGSFIGMAGFATTPAATNLASAGASDVFVAKFSTTGGACAWAVRAGGNLADVGYGVAADASGNALVTGYINGTASFATSPATSLTSAGGTDVFVAKFGTTGGACAWAVRAGGGGADVGYGIAADASGNALVTGSFAGLASFASPNDAIAPSTGLFAAQLAGGTGAWQAPTLANNGSSSTGWATASDAAGNQYVTGSFAGTITLGSTTLTSAGGTDVLVAKRSAATGAWLWAVRAGGAGADEGYGIAVDASGNALVTGIFAGTASFATGPAATSLTSAGNTEAFVAKFGAASGACAWAVSAGGTGSDGGNSLAVDASGNALVTGVFAGTASFATSPAATSLTSAGSSDVFVAKFSAADGTCTWAVRAGSTVPDVGYNIAADASGNALVVGYFQGTASFATSPVATSFTAAGNNDVFVAKFGAADGACAWAVRAGGTSADYGYGVAVDASGNALVTGTFNGTASFATSPAATSLTAAAGSDAFVAKFDAASGACAWAVRAGGPNNDVGYGVVVDANGNALVTGSFAGTASFGTASLVGAAGVISTGFVAWVGLAPTITSFSPVSGPVGTTVTLTGTNLANASSVSFNGTAQTVFASNNSTQLVLNVPAGATTGTLTVTTPGGTSAASSQVFTVCPAPVALAQNVTLTLDASGTAALTAAQVNNGSTANCGAAPASALRVSPASFSCANTGANTVTLTVTDAGGNTATATATVTVSIPALSATTWTGTADNDPTNCANWSYGQGPTATISAVIPAGLTTYPVLSTGTLATNDLTVANGASFTLNGGATLAVNGSFNNSGTANLSGMVRLVGGAATQTLSNDGGFTTVVVHKSAGTVQLGQNLTINSALTLTSGTLTTGSYQVNLGGSAILNETDASYVLGKVVVNRTLAPGTAESFAGLGLTLTPATGSVPPGATLVTRTTGTALAGAGSSQSIRRYFDIRPATNTGLNVTMDFAYLDHELNGIPTANLALFKSVSGGAPWLPQRGTTAAGNVITKTGIADFSVWTLGNAANPLPVELTAFTATPAGPAAVRLAWATASEKHSARFEVERSLDGETFAAIGTVAAAGTSSSTRRYELLDAKLPGAALLYYRLKQVDADGTFSYSPVRTVALAGAGAGLSLYPNPARGGAATLTGALPGTVVTVTDALGRPVARATADAAGTAALVLPAGLPAGVYVVRAGSRAIRLTVE